MSTTVWLRDKGDGTRELVADCPECDEVCVVVPEHEAHCPEHGQLDIPALAVWRVRPERS